MKPQRSQRNTLCPQKEWIKRQRYREAENRLVGRDEAIFEVKALEARPRTYEPQALIY